MGKFWLKPTAPFCHVKISAYIMKTHLISHGCNYAYAILFSVTFSFFKDYSIILAYFKNHLMLGKEKR